MSGDINVQSFSGKVNISNNLLVGSSHLFVDTVNNRVGITTASPGASLEVNGNVHVGTDLTLGGTLTGDGSGLTNVNSDSGLWAGAGTGSVYLSTSTDNVGIGTTNPMNTGLHIANSYFASGGNTDHFNPQIFVTGNSGTSGNQVSAIGFSGNSTGDTHQRMVGGAVYYKGGGGFYGLQGYLGIAVPDISTGGADPYGLTEGELESHTRLAINNSGKVGIGITEPTEVLDIKPATSSDSAFIRVRSGSGGTNPVTESGLKLTESGEYGFQFVHSGATDLLKIRHQNSAGAVDRDDMMVWNPNGNVGIGTTSPSATLELFKGFASTGLYDTATLKFSTTNTTNNWDVGSIRGAVKLNAGGTSGYPGGLVFATKSPSADAGGGLTDKMVIDANGNVGIGTTSPSEKLDVVGGPTKSDGFILSTANNVYTPGCIYTDSNWGMLFRSAVSSPGVADFLFNDYAGNQMMVINDNKVGIGTTSPNHKLEVSGGILADYIAIPEINLHGARFGYVIEYRYSGMPSSAPTDESSMNSEFGQAHSSSITTNTQMRYPYGTAATNIGRMWIGIIQATSTGVYTFGVNSDDASDLFVAGYRVADWYSGHGHNTSNINIPGGNQRTIYLKGGQWYKVKARFEENGGGEAFFALWKKPGDTSFSEIPSGNLAYILSDYSSAPTSDDRLKVNETMISNATDTIIKLKPQIYDKFEFIEDVHDTKNKPIRESGLIAQDIWYDAPELRHIVYPYKTPNETREVNEDIRQDPDYSDWGPVAAQVNYFGVIPYLIKSFQELHENVTSERVKTQEMKEDLQTTRTELEQALEAEKEKTKNLESRLAFLETAVASLIS